MKQINLINTFLIKLGLIASAVILPSAIALATCNYSDFQGWKDCFIEEKLSNRLGGIDVSILQQAQFIPEVIELDQKQPEKKFTFAQYLKLIDLEGKIAQGQRFYDDNKDIINKIAADYNVDPGVLVALIGMESSYGVKQGNFNIIDSLATLAYEGRRKSFFEKELINILMIAKNDNLAYEEIKGSWAGAMGQCQFMPSSYLHFAIDYNNDGKKDIWSSLEDVIASAAHYLAKSGWKAGDIYVKKTNKATADTYANCGDKSKVCHSGEEYDLIFLKEHDKKDEHYFVSKNFNVLMKWNRSFYFGLATLMIANRVSD